MSKKVVHYVPHKLDYIKIGLPAQLAQTVDHPLLSNKLPDESRCVWTSRVVRIGLNGEFETLNTIYRPKEEI